MKVSRGVASEKAWTGAASAIAHDIKTPLATLQVAVDTLLTPGVGTSRRRFLGSVVRRQVSRLDSMVTELIESLRLTSGDLKLDLVPYDVNQLVAEACADFRLLDPDRQFLFAAPNQELVLSVDVDKLRRIVDNLLSNAATHSATTAPVRVSVQLHEVEEMVVLRVSDEGAGVPESERDRIAEPFVSLNPAARGQGLGLFSVRLIAGAHGGRVWTETTPKSFSVCVGLPLSVEDSSQA